MHTVELIQFSLDLAFEQLEHVVKDLRQEQAEWICRCCMIMRGPPH